MSRINLKFLFRKKKQIKIIQFSAIKSYIEKIKKEGEVSEYYEKLNMSYENLMKKTDEIKKNFKKLENMGEKNFTALAGKTLEKIEKVDEFKISSFQKFYTNTFYIINKIEKIPVHIQYELLKYEEGKKTIELLNSFLKDANELKKVLAMRYGKYSAVNHLENATKKADEIENILNNIKDVEKKIESIRKEKEDTERLLERKLNSINHTKSDINTKRVIELRNRIKTLDDKISKIEFDLRSNILRARRPISKILHSKNKKLFEFFQNFMKYPLENINENFWKVVALIRFKDNKLNKDESRLLDEFLTFTDHELKRKIDDYNNLREEKNQLRDTLKKVSSENEKALKKIGDEKKNLEENVKTIDKRLKNLERERHSLQLLLKKNIKTLEIMIKKASGDKIKVKI